MPEDPSEDPVRYAQCMRLLWLAASMKAFDVVICLLPTDEENLAMCELIGDMAPMLQYTRRRESAPPQVVAVLGAPERHREALRELSPAPLVLPRRTAMPSLVCEVLHPAAHWSGALDSTGKEPMRLDAAAVAAAAAAATADARRRGAPADDEGDGKEDAARAKGIARGAADAFIARHSPFSTGGARRPNGWHGHTRPTTSPHQACCNDEPLAWSVAYRKYVRLEVVCVGLRPVLPTWLPGRRWPGRPAPARAAAGRGARAARSFGDGRRARPAICTVGWKHRECVMC